MSATVSKLGVDEAFTAHMGHDVEVDDCAFCRVRPMLELIHQRWNEGTTAESELIWAMQDGYGEPGFMPLQGHDWSGVRDSTPETIEAIYQALMGADTSGDRS